SEPAACSGGLGDNCDRCPANGSPTGGWLLGGICHDTQPMECQGGGECPDPTWETSEWGDCSNGEQHRTVRCICQGTGQETMGCNVNIRPADTQDCDPCDTPNTCYWVCDGNENASGGCRFGADGQSNIQCNNLGDRQICAGGRWCTPSQCGGISNCPAY